MTNHHCDVCIIGAGVVGSAIARELSRYKLDIVVVEKEDDVSCGASKANSGIVHGGYAAKHGTLKGLLNVQGNAMFTALNGELNFGYRETGALVIGFDNEDLKAIDSLYRNGCANGVSGLEVINASRVLELEPEVNPAVTGALYCRHAGVASPYEMTIALAENAVTNGVRLLLNSEVKAIDAGNKGFVVHCNNCRINSTYVVNAAGTCSDRVSAMVGMDYFSIIPRRGQYVLFDRDTGLLVNHVIFQTPTRKGKGILVTGTYWGNLMVGPNAEEVDSPDDLGTDAETLNYIVETAKKSVPSINMARPIRSFSGIRATPDRGDFIIEETAVKGFINAAGIESPGLTSSPAIALMVVSILQKAGLKLDKDPDFDPYRGPVIKKRENLPPGEVERLIKSASSDERIICRCEQVREGTIIDALNRGIPIDSTDAVKRRTRAGMGRCQGAFCGPRVRDLIARETGLPADKIKLADRGSGILPD